MLFVVAVSCSDPADPAPAVESVVLSLDSIAIQFRDSASELSASARGALGVELDAEVRWRVSSNADVLTLAPNGKTVRLIPRRPGTAEVEAASESIIASATVVVLDTVFRVMVNTTDTLVTLGRTTRFTADVSGPPNALKTVTWRVADSSKARIDSVSPVSNTAYVTSRDTGRTELIAISDADRLKTDRVPFRTAQPLSLYFDAQPGQASSPIRAQDILIPGPIVKVRDALGNPYPGSVTVSMALTPGTGSPNANLFGTLQVSTASEDGRFTNVGVDVPGTDFRLTATSPGLEPATSAPFTVGPECPGIPYAIGTTVSGTLTSSACQASEGVWYDRYVVTTTTAQLFTARMAAPHRVGVVFNDGARFTVQTDSVPYLAAPGTYSIRVLSGSNGELGQYQLATRFANIPKGTFATDGYICWRIQTQRGIVYQEELRCASGATPTSTIAFRCGSGVASTSPYRLHLPPNATVTVTASSTAFDPCLEIRDNQNNQSLALDDNSGGGTTARIVLAPSIISRDIIIVVTGRQPLPANTPFTISIQP